MLQKIMQILYKVHKNTARKGERQHIVPIYSGK